MCLDVERLTGKASLGIVRSKVATMPELKVMPDRVMASMWMFAPDPGAKAWVISSGLGNLPVSRAPLGLLKSSGLPV